MMDLLWAVMVLTGIGFGILNGTTDAVGVGILESAKEALQLCLSLAAVMGLWTGLMEIAKEAGALEWLSRKGRPLLKILFPEVPVEHPAFAFITTNLTANVLGLGGASTPAGLSAMEKLKELHPGERASNAMCTLLVLNVSSLQLIPVTVIAFRSQYGSVSPAGIVLPGLIATTASTAVAAVFCIWMNSR